MRCRFPQEMPSFLWTLINAVQAISTGLWSAFWIGAALVVRWVSGGSVLPLTMARRCWAPGLLRIGQVRVEVEGLENVDFSRPHVFAANHQSIIDVLALYYALPTPLIFVLKEELRRVPFLGWYASAMGMLFVRRGERQALKTLAKSGERIADGKSILTFPEGTRSRDGKLAAFKPGAFLPAIDFGVPVVAVALDGSEKIIPPGTFRVRPGTVRVAVGEPILTAGLGRGDRRALAEQVRDRVSELRRRIAPG